MPRWVSSFNVIGSKGDLYKVSVGDNGTWGCSCPAWKFARAHDGVKPACKHIIATRDGIQLEVVRRRQDRPMPAVVTGRARTAEREQIARELAAVAPSGPTDRFAGLDFGEAELKALAAEGARFRHLEYDIETRAA